MSLLLTLALVASAALPLDHTILAAVSQHPRSTTDESPPAGVAAPTDLVRGGGVGASSAVPAVSSVLPGNCTPNLPVWTNVSVRFTTAMEPNATLSAFSVRPSVAGATPAVSGTYLNWTLSQPLAPATTYQVSVSTAARSAAGVALGGPWRSSFSTAVANVGSVPVASAACPIDGSTNVPLDAEVQVAFDTVMDPSTLVASFSISPAVPGGEPGAGGCCLTLVHAHPFEPTTTYTVRVSTNASSIAGVHLARPFSFNFTTGAAPAANSTPVGGPGTHLSFEEGVAILVGGVVVIAATSSLTYLWIRRQRSAEQRPPSDGAPEGEETVDEEGTDPEPSETSEKSETAQPPRDD